MRPLVNLSSEPFRNRRLFWLAILLIFALASAVGFKTIHSLSDLDDQIAKLEPVVKKHEDEVKVMEKKAPLVAALTPEQNHTLHAANDLIARKAFSWSQLLNDLERYMTPNVRVLRIGVDKVTPRAQGTVSESSNKTVNLALEVIAKSVPDGSRLIDDLNKSAVFAAQPKGWKPIEGLPDVQFSIDLVYHPAESPSAPRTKLANQVAEGRP